MKAVIQRVKHSSVTVDGELISKINNGFMILLGVMEGDTEEDANKLVKKIPNLRIFEDDNGKMNLSLLDTLGEILYEYVADELKKAGVKDVKTGIFGADMKVDLLNDGPVTIILDSKELK